MQIRDLFKRIRSEGVTGANALVFADNAYKPRGFVSVRIWRGPVGSCLEDDIFLGEVDLGENLVVTLARRIMSRLLVLANQGQDPGPPPGPVYDPTITTIGSGDITITAATELKLTKMKWGTGGHDPLNPTQPLDPDPTDEDLASPIASPVTKTVSYHYPDDLTVMMIATLEQAEGNGNGISEVGLFTDSHNLLFARKCHGMMTKSADFSFEYRYSIIF